MIKTQNYVNYEKYKLNIKIPLVYSLKYFLTCIYLWHQFSTHSDEASDSSLDSKSGYKVSREELMLIEHVLK